MTRALGYRAEVTNVNVNQNMVEHRGANSTEIQVFTFGDFNGSFDASWVWSSPWALDLFLARNATFPTGAGPYTYVWASLSDGAGEAAKNKKTATFELGLDETTDIVRKPLGVAGSSLTLSTALNQPVTARAGFVYDKETDPTTVLDTTVATDDWAYPYATKDMTLEIPTATSLSAQLQSSDLTINANPKLSHGHNDEFANAVTWGDTSITGSITMEFRTAAAILQKVIGTGGRAEVASMTWKITNGLAGVNEKSLTLVGTGIGIGSHSVSYTIDGVIYQTFPITVRRLVATAVVNIASAP